MRFLFQVAVALALIVGALAKPAMNVLDNSSGREAIVIHAVNEMQVKANRSIFEAEYATDADIIAIYGSATNDGKPTRIMFANEKLFIRPQEKPELVLYGIKDAEKDKPLQAQALHFAADRAMKGGLGFGILGLLILLFVWKDKK